jgi:hypothetical protein
MALYNATFNVTTPFLPYVTPNLTMHFAQQKRNSKTFNNTNTAIKDSVIAYIESKCISPVYVDNNAYDTQDGWQRVNHNCHGINNLRNEAHIAILSAINYSGLVSAFLVDVAGMTTQQVRNSLIGEIAHQVIMRGALRCDNNNECHVYLMEMELAAYLQDNIFAKYSYHIISDTDRPERGPLLTPAQSKKATLIRKNFAAYALTPTDVLMKDSIWSFTNSNGVYSKLYRQITEDNARDDARIASQLGQEKVTQGL